jgi:sortase A
MRIAVRAIGWLCIAAGVLVGLYLVYALYWTGLATSRAQESLLQSFELEVGTLQPLTAGDDIAAGAVSPADPASPLAVDGEAIAAMEFFRPGDGGPVVLDAPVMVVEGVTEQVLTTGPGRYPGTAQPGEDGNFAVAGHRTTHGAPFWNLDQLQDGDEIHVTDRNGTRWVYAFAETRIVPPSDVSVLAPDPLDTGAPTLTLTTCHPRWSQTERMIVFAELIGSQPATAAADDA